jgi:hypothetical protein
LSNPQPFFLEKLRRQLVPHGTGHGGCRLQQVSSHTTNCGGIPCQVIVLCLIVSLARCTNQQYSSYVSIDRQAGLMRSLVLPLSEINDTTTTRDDTTGKRRRPTRPLQSICITGELPVTETFRMGKRSLDVQRRRRASRS